MKAPATTARLASLLLLTGCQQVAPTSAPATPGPAAPAATPPPADDTAYLFGWGRVPADTAKPRGGSSRGAPVTLAPGRPLPLPAVAAARPDFERDRAAILSLAGDYKVSFHFLETIGFTPGHETPQPYHSWATEQVRIIEDTGRFLSLQHTLVMFFKQDDGAVSAPALVKHWRQDWNYEDTDLHTFRGDRTWARRRVSPADAAGRWSQAVFQVDDSPRYEALGRWEHDGNRSVWAGETAWRPLPRREFSVRKDYDVMEGRHRITLTPTGWLHEQDNWKRVAGDSTPGAPHYLAHEAGLDRYERITAPALAAADEYWERTRAYWAAVRQAWRDIHAAHDRFTLHGKVEGKTLFEHHFEFADKIPAGAPYDAATGERHARETIRKFLDAGSRD